MNEKNGRLAHRRMVAGQGILTNHGRNNNSPATGPQRSRFAPEQIHAPEAVFHVAQERQPGGAIGVLCRSVVTGEREAACAANKNIRFRPWGSGCLASYASVG
jgi:hypothetical protein